MHKNYLRAAIQALMISVPLTLVIAFAVGEFSWRSMIVAVILFAVIWIVMVGRTPKVQDSLSTEQTGIRNQS